VQYRTDQMKEEGLPMSNPNTKTLTFSMLVEEVQGAFVGHCLETGLVASAITEQDVVAKMSKLLERQIRFALENDRLGDIYHPAPKEVFAKFQAMEERLVSTCRTPLKGHSNKPWFTIAQTAYAPAC